MIRMDPVRLNKAALRRLELRLGSIGATCRHSPRLVLQDDALCKALLVVEVRDVDRFWDVNVCWVGRHRHSTS
jgi:hypothetical protein